MAYFNHAFVKCFNPAGAMPADGTATSALTAGQIVFVDGSTWQSVSPTNAPLPAAGNLGYIVQGSYHTQDSIGNNPGHGGYTESVKSKGINPRYVSRLYSTDVVEASQSTSVISVASTCAPCDDPLYLRLDVKGSPALRFLNHNAYAVADSDGACCSEPGQTYVDPALALAQAGTRLVADPIVSPFVRERQWGTGASAVVAGIVVTKTGGGLNGVDSTSTVNAGGSNYTTGDIVSVNTGSSLAVLQVTATAGAVTAFTVLAAGSGYTAGSKATTNVVVANAAATGFTVTVVQDADAASFSMAQIIDATYTASTDPVTDGVSAAFHIEGAYAETKFGACSFDTRDFYGKEPVQLNLAILDETGDPCNDCGVTVNTPGVMASTVGETVLRDILMTENYMQSPYNQGNPDSARIREIEGSDDIVGSVDRTALYKVYVIQHSVPRFNNPTSTFDNDQYCYKIYVKSTDAALIADMDTLMGEIATWCNASGGNVAFVSGIETP